MKYNMLTVEREDIGVNRFNQGLWLCRCDCGTPCIKLASYVRNGRTKSCGCLKSAGNRRTHGQCRSKQGRASKAYSSWCNMKNRCDSSKNAQWKDYGGRGITYDPRWATFAKFFADMGEPPPGHSIDRIDNNKGYCKKNCRWADDSTQRRNNRRSVVWCQINGERLILTDAIKKYGVVPFQTAVNRVCLGWTPEDAVLTPYTRNFAHVTNGGKRYKLNGKSLTLAEWSKETGIGRTTLLLRLKNGVPLEQALTVRGFLGFRRQLRKTSRPKGSR